MILHPALTTEFEKSSTSDILAWMEDVVASPRAEKEIYICFVCEAENYGEIDVNPYDRRLHEAIIELRKRYSK